MSWDMSIWSEYIVSYVFPGLGRVMCCAAVSFCLSDVLCSHRLAAQRNIRLVVPGAAFYVLGAPILYSQSPHSMSAV